MKYLGQLFSILILSLIFGLYGCQEEAQEIVTPMPTEIISLESKSGEFLFRISQQQGSGDNIIDGSSCTSIVFPFTVIINGASVEITSEDDFDLIEDIIDELEDDSDNIEIQFPIEVSLPDNTVVTIATMDELEDLLDECDDDDDIECLDIVYPITFSIYNQIREQASTTTIENDRELYQFLDQIEDSEIVSLIYPIDLVLFNNDMISINSNQELEAAVELYEDSCDEDDDDHDIDVTELNNILKESIWMVAKYDSAAVDKSGFFIGIDISFLDDNILLAKTDSEEIDGEWETSGDDGFLQLSTEFDSDGNLNLLNRDWKLEHFNNDSIKITALDTDEVINVIMTVK
ncbi:hypothetical protein [Marivirga harenae]|uniref:hypothetical protein n=1 Tax=Marivirga harenae TaxID=2010992 RepID=UPI0026E0F2FD|nr:hypothetical protein [Marivirga harenae]WKV10643.1 hypothetical protein Q3Y49_10500 [Marivirga harenae]